MEIRQRSTRTVYANPWMTVREDEIEHQDGSIGIYGIVEKDDFALVIPRDDTGLHLVQQFRYPVGERCWEFPQGSWDPGLGGDAQALARAELAEETGLRAGRMRHLGHLYQSYGYCSQGFDVFLATELTPGEPSRGVGEQGMRVEHVTADRLAAMIRDGALKDAPSVAAYGLLLLS